MTPSSANRVLTDAGPLVAIFEGGDPYHQTCMSCLREMRQPLYTCWPVITEAAWLLRHSAHAVQRLLSGMNGDFLELLPLVGSEAGAIAAIMKRYESIRPQLADAALVYLAERERIDTIFTLDRRDFSIYRTSRKKALRLVPLVD